MSPPPGTGVRLQAADLNATLLALGELTGFFVPDGDDVAVDAGIFADPLAADYLGGIPGRAGKLAALIATILPPAAEFGPTDTLPTGNVWLPITVPDSESDSSTADSPEPDGDSGKEPAAGADGSAPARLAYLVVPPDDATSGVFGFGVWRKFEPVTGVEITLSVFVPVVQVGPTAVSFALLDHPILATVGIAGPSGSFLGQKVSLNGLAVTASLHLNGTAPSFKLSCLDTTPPIADTYATLAELISSGGTVTEYLNAVIGSAPVTQVLGIAVAGEGDSAVTVGEVFVALGVLQAATPPAYQLVDLAAAFGGKSPIAIAETMLFRSLDLVIKALGDRPVIPIEIAGSKGGLYLASESMADGSERFGVRLAVTDLAITAAPEPSIVLQIGELLSGEQTDEAWMVRAGGSAAEPGISVFVLHVTGLAETDPQLSLVIDVEAVSIGVDIAGADDKPLIDVDGYTLAKIEARAMVVPGEHGIVVGAAVKVDGLGIPLGPGFNSKSGKNPVATSLVASGDGDGGTAATGKTDAVNPAFSVSGAYVSGGSFAAALYDADGKAAKEVWIPIQRAFGPLQVARIGIGWDSPMFSLGFDGGVSLGPLKIVLTELTLVLPIDHPTDFDRYELDLQGLSISFDEPPVEIAGAFAKITSADHDGNPMVGYAGAAAVVVGPFGLAALGEYGHVTTPAGEYTTMFIFAVVDAPLGGIPPYFFVTAAAAGFGYNSELIIPAFDAVTTFPLVAGLDDPAFLAVSDPKKGLAAIGESIRPRQGQYWLAAGVRFTSFELVESVALIVVEFGAELEIALLGLSKLKLPPEGHAFISIEMGIEIVIKPDEGFFGASAVLTAGSYLLAEACHITGGFAFFLWYGNNAHAGQFVLTIGGYYSGFVAPMRPDYYPDIPIVGFNWVVSDTVTIKGGGYFALTPSQVMTGGGLDLMFHAGPIRAWFIAQFDVVIGWAPFHLLAHIAVDIGISLHLKFLFINVTITLELGCNVTVWGPPTGGTVTIHLLIISFTISFGRPQDAIAPTLGWPDFQATLPAPSPADAKRPVRQNVIKVVANGGVTGTIDEADGTTTWVVRPDHFVFSVHSAIPAATVTVTGATNVDYAAPAVSFRPMGLEGMSSAQTVSMTAEVDGHAGSVDLAHDWIHAAATQDLPEAVWGPGAPPAKVVEPTSIPGMAIGLTGVAPRPPTPVTTGAIDIATAFTYFPINEAPAALPINAVAAPTGGPAPTADDDALDRIATTIATTAAPARAALFAALRRIGVDPGIDGPLDLLAANPTGTYGANPLIGAPILAGVQ